MKFLVLSTLCLLVFTRAQNELCDEDVYSYFNGSVNASLLLECNLTHLLSTVSIRAERGSFFYTYYFGIKCQDDSSEQTVRIVIHNGVHFPSEHSFTNVATAMLSYGWTCSLFGCYRDIGSVPRYYAVSPAVCIIDEDECLTRSHKCSDWADCINDIGGYNCSCWQGYEGDGHNCTDVDECRESVQNCSNLAWCQNIPGGYMCTCRDGYEGDGYNCTDKDECDISPAVCGPNSTCSNVAGSYECSCSEGFIYLQNQCQDINECEIGEHECSENGICVNFHGGFYCVCKDGYEGDGYNCSDKDECDISPAVCGPNSTCSNVAGSYECSCSEGFIYLQNQCQDINECEIGEHECSENGICVNFHGGFYCVCKDGYEGDGYNCSGDVGSSNLSLVALPFSLLVLVIVICLFVLVIRTSCSKKKRWWLYAYEMEVRKQELDQDFMPVDPEPSITASLISIIEPLHKHYELDSSNTVACVTRNESELEEGSCSSNEQSSKQVGQDPERDSRSIQAAAVLINSNGESHLSSQPGADSILRQSSCLKDESGFVSDTSSSHYLSFYQLSHRL